jgi:hypothetical protein
MTIDAPIEVRPAVAPVNDLLTSPILPTLLKLAIPNTIAMFGSTLVAVADLVCPRRRRDGGVRARHGAGDQGHALGQIAPENPANLALH